MSFFGRVTQQFPQEKGFETSDFKAGGCCCSLSFRKSFFHLEIYKMTYFNQKSFNIEF